MILTANTCDLSADDAARIVALYNFHARRVHVGIVPMDDEADERTQSAEAALPQSNFDVAMARCWAGTDAILIDSSLFCGLEPHAITEMISTIEDALDEGANQYDITVAPHLGVLRNMVACSGDGSVRCKPALPGIQHTAVAYVIGEHVVAVEAVIPGKQPCVAPPSRR